MHAFDVCRLCVICNRKVLVRQSDQTQNWWETVSLCLNCFNTTPANLILAMAMTNSQIINLRLAQDATAQELRSVVNWLSQPRLAAS